MNEIKNQDTGAGRLCHRFHLLSHEVTNSRSSSKGFMSEKSDKSVPSVASLSRFAALCRAVLPAGFTIALLSSTSVPPIIQVDNITKVYRIGKVDVPALRGVSFEIKKGEFVSIVGPSGSGKSTLFYVMGGLTRATTGRVLVDGDDFARMSDAQRTEMRKRKIGFVFQKFNLLPPLTARDNIEIAREISGQKNGASKEFMDQVLQMLGIAGRLDHRPSEMSGGEQQRVALARALVNRPAIVLADEPTGNLDSRNSDVVLKMLRDANQQFGQTVLMITHNPGAASIGDRIIHMRDGQVISAADDPQWAGIQARS
jgi:putative ABC transport system ATP-binding protein